MAASPGAEDRHNPRSEATDHPSDGLALMRALAEHERRQRRESREAQYRRQLLSAAGIEADKLTEQGQRILNWLTGWDDWTIGGLVEILQATRTAAQVAIHRDGIDGKVAALRESENATQAALDRYDEQGGLGL